MGEKFTKRTMKWGLLQRVAQDDKPWSFVNSTKCLFDDELSAYKKANEWNLARGTPAYLYKPVEVLIEVEVDRELK